jgi:hypothetical protein
MPWILASSSHSTCLSAMYVLNIWCQSTGRREISPTNLATLIKYWAESSWDPCCKCWSTLATRDVKFMASISRQFKMYGWINTSCTRFSHNPQAMIRMNESKISERFNINNRKVIQIPIPLYFRKSTENQSFYRKLIHIGSSRRYVRKTVVVVLCCFCNI